MLITRVAVIYFTSLIFFVWGIAAARYEIFPWNQIYTVYKFVRGDVTETTSLSQKLLNDLDIVPERFMRNYAPTKAARLSVLKMDGIRARRNSPRLWISPTARSSYRLIVGALDFEKAFWGGILLDPSGKVMRRWYMNAEIPTLSNEADILKNLYGVAFFTDGSAAFTMQENSGGIVKIDACSEVTWTKKGLFHHVISPTEDALQFWTFGGKQYDLHPKLLLVDAFSGKTVKEIDMADVEKTNPDIFIFDLHRKINVKNPTHPNDIEPLPSAMAGAYPKFSAGDLLISYHTTNLIFVIDPETLKIKWWYVGAGDRQHDPDWQSDASISIFSNNWRANQRGVEQYSSIVSIDPQTHSHETIVDGGRYDFYSKINGRHQFTKYGSVIVTSSTQGRVFEVDLASGEVIFEFVNSYDWEDGRTLHLSETFVIEEALAKRWAAASCPTVRAPGNESRKQPVQ